MCVYSIIGDGKAIFCLIPPEIYKKKSRNRIIHSASPRMATAYPLRREQTPLRRPILPQRLDSILAASGRISAGRGQMRRDGKLIEANRKNQQSGSKAFHASAPFSPLSLCSTLSPSDSFLLFLSARASVSFLNNNPILRSIV